MEKKTILLVEDNPDDEALTLRALKKTNLANEVIVVRDGVEAWEFLTGTGAVAGREMDMIPHLTASDCSDSFEGMTGRSFFPSSFSHRPSKRGIASTATVSGPTAMYVNPWILLSSWMQRESLVSTGWC
jgi:CheY-like chemotaxis protein